MSTYHKVNSGVSAVSSDIFQDISWQSTLQRTWEKIIHGKGDGQYNSLQSQMYAFYKLFLFPLIFCLA